MPTNEQWNNYGAQVNQLTAPSITAAAATSDSRKGREYADKVNRENREEARRIMEQQREWALSDWHMVNAYNAPDQQMQRYKDAGLNPNLIYGSATNSPASMVKNTTQGAARAEASGYIEALGIRSRGIAGAMQQAQNNYFANQALKNDTNLKTAQILNLKEQSDKTALDNQLTQKNFTELAIKAAVDNEQVRAKTALDWEKGTRLPSMQDQKLLNKADLEKQQAQAKHAEELYKLAEKENALKGEDVDMIKRLGASPKSIQYVIDFLKIILKITQVKTLMLEDADVKNAKKFTQQLPPIIELELRLDKNKFGYIKYYFVYLQDLFPNICRIYLRERFKYSNIYLFPTLKIRPLGFFYAQEIRLALSINQLTLWVYKVRREPSVYSSIYN